MRMEIRFALRGALGFGLGGLLVTLAHWQVFGDIGPQGLPPHALPTLLCAYFLSGAIGIGTLIYREWLTDSPLRAMGGFGLGFIAAGLMTMFTMISLQGGGAPDYLWGALGFGIGFAVAGGLGGFCVQPMMAVWGALAFGAAGALAGAAAFWLTAHQIGAGWGDGWHAVRDSVAMLLAYVLGGGLFGATIR